MAFEVRLAPYAFNAKDELARFIAAQPGAGGIVSFLGQVRADSSEGAVLELELSHYEPLTPAGILGQADQATKRWSLDGLLIIHRVGRMAAGEPIVLVAAAARHRRDAFLAADFTMDHLKSEAWFWKRERTAAGWRWIEPRESDHIDRERWSAVHALEPELR